MAGNDTVTSTRDVCYNDNDMTVCVEDGMHLGSSVMPIASTLRRFRVLMGSHETGDHFLRHPVSLAWSPFGEFEGYILAWSSFGEFEGYILAWSSFGEFEGYILAWSSFGEFEGYILAWSSFGEFEGYILAWS